MIPVGTIEHNVNIGSVMILILCSLIGILNNKKPLHFFYYFHIDVKWEYKVLK